MKQERKDKVIPMNGNTSVVGNNIKSFHDGKQVEKGSDPMPRGSGQLPNGEVSLDIKDFNRNKSTASGVEK